MSKEGVFWSVRFEIVDEEARKKLEKRQGSTASGEKDGSPTEQRAGEAEAEGAVSDDVD